MKHGTVYQRHLASCPRDESGKPLPHRCRGRWAYILYYGRDSNGRRLQTTKSGFATKADAQTALQERVRVLRASVNTHALTVGEYLDQWLAGKHALKPATLANYRDLTDGYLVPHLGQVKLLDLKAHHLDRMYSSITLGRRGTPLSPASIRRVHAVLRSALNAAVKRRLIPYSPADHIELAAENPRRPRPWTAQQCGEFLDSIKADRMAFLYELLMVTGLRRGEVVGLRWEDVDVNCKALFITQQIVDVGGRLIVGKPKTKRGARVVPLDIETAARLREHRVTTRLEREANDAMWEDHGLVFTQTDGRPLRPEFVTKHFKVLTRAAGLPIIRLHDLRHTNASLALEAGVPLKVVSDRLGHSQTAITADLYTHVNRGVGQDAADQIAAVLRRTPSRPDAQGTLSSNWIAPGQPEGSQAVVDGLGTNKAPDRVSAGQGPDP